MFTDFDVEPSAADLAAIEDERPLIEAELEELDAEIRLLSAEGRVCDLDVRRVRRAQAAVLRERAAYARLLAAPAHECWLTVEEVGMSSCRYGCKWMRCARCGRTEVWHNATYGCRTVVGYRMVAGSRAA